MTVVNTSHEPLILATSHWHQSETLLASNERRHAVDVPARWYCDAAGDTKV